MNEPDSTVSVAGSADPQQTSPFLAQHDAGLLGPHALVGDYEILGEIAHGGMGVVYKAHQRSLNRVVALKMMRAGEFASDDEVQRFHVEAEAAAKLDHPHIVPIYEISQIGGQHFFSMAFVEGTSLAGEVTDGPLDPRRAATLMRQVCDAVGYAHAQGVIHRDLKPGNVLIDGTGLPRVTDFGLAKRADADSSLTQAGQVMGTPSYMSPEQAEGKNEQVGPLSDVYSLGATLYCLITGRPPFQSASVVETIKQVVEREPVAPHHLNPAVGRDLDTICLKCLEKRPEKRYTSATALAEDLQRFLQDRSILARPVGDAEKMVRWCRRNPIVAASLTGIAAIFVTAFVLVSWSYVRAENARKDEAKQRQEADEARDEAQHEQKAERWGRYRSIIAAASGALQLQNSGAARSALEDAPLEHRNWEWQHLHSQLDGASLVLPGPGGRLYTLALSPSGRQFAVSYAGDNQVYLSNLATGRLEAVLRGHLGTVTSVVFRPDGKQVATASEDQTIRLWDAATGQSMAVFKPEVSPSSLDSGASVAYSSDGCRIASYSPIGPGTSRLWSTTTFEEIAVLAKWQEGLRPIAFSPDGQRVAAASGQHISLCDAVTGRQLAVLGAFAKPVICLAYSSDGKRIAAAAGAGDTVDDHAIKLWDAESHREVAVLLGHTATVRTVVFSPDGSRLISGSEYPDNTARLWDANTGRMVAVLSEHKNAVPAAGFSPDGRYAVTASYDQTARVWDGRTGQLLAVLKGHAGPVRMLLFSPNSKRVVTASDDATLRLWDVQNGELTGVLRGHSSGFAYPSLPLFSPDGARLVTGSVDGTVRMWDMSLVERSGVLKGHTSYVYDVAFDPNGEQVVSVAWDGTARLWDAGTGHQTGLLMHESKIVSSVVYSRDGGRLVTVERERGVTLWDVAHQKIDRDWRFAAGDWQGDSRVSFNPAATLLAAGSADGPVQLWNVATRREVARLEGHEKHSTDVTFHPDGSLLATAGMDGTVRLWDVATHDSVAVLRGHTDAVWRVAFSADGKLLASGSRDKTIRLWDAQTRELLNVIPVGSIVYSVAFSPDGTRLAAACADNTIRLIDVASRQHVAELRGHTDYVHAVAWSPDGTRLVSGSGDHMVRVWDSLSAQERAKRGAGR